MAAPIVSEALTRQVANLARLELTDEEVHLFTSQLAEVLGYMETLESVDVEGVEPLTHPSELSAPLREDSAREFGLDSEGHPRILASAPEVYDDGFKVPPIL